MSTCGTGGGSRNLLIFCNTVTFRPRDGIQTYVYIVPVDSDSSLRNLLKVRTVRFAFEEAKGGSSVEVTGAVCTPGVRVC